MNAKDEKLKKIFNDILREEVADYYNKYKKGYFDKKLQKNNIFEYLLQLKVAGSGIFFRPDEGIRRLVRLSQIIKDKDIDSRKYVAIFFVKEGGNRLKAAISKTFARFYNISIADLSDAQYKSAIEKLQCEHLARYPDHGCLDDETVRGQLVDLLIQQRITDEAGDSVIIAQIKSRIDDLLSLKFDKAEEIELPKIG